MNTVTIIGVILLALGAIGLIYGGITYVSSSDVVDLGVVQVQVDQKKHIPLSPIFGGVAAALGVVLVVVGRRRRGDGGSL
jgi:hypothetical protein